MLAIPLKAASDVLSGWNVGEGSDLPRDLRLMVCAAAPGSGHPGSRLLLGLHEGQPAPAELHIEPPPSAAHPLFSPPDRRKDGFKNKSTPKTEYLFKSKYRMKRPSSS